MQYSKLLLDMDYTDRLMHPLKRQTYSATKLELRNQTKRELWEEYKINDAG